MIISPPIEPIDYLLIGHLTKDLTPSGHSLGGTASFSALTAQALGLRVGIVTSCNEDLNRKALDGIPTVILPSEYSTTFENVQTPEGRIQYCYHTASALDLSIVPDLWRQAPIIHLGPVAQEVQPSLARAFKDSMLCLTPQGWLRKWDSDGRVFRTEWPESAFVLEQASIAVISVEDVQGDEQIIEDMASSSKILVVTEGKEGARVYWNGDLRRIRPPMVKEVDPVGAGDIFSAAFFSRYYTTRDPWEAARFATQIAANSVTRPGLSGVPTRDEILSYITEIL